MSVAEAVSHALARLAPARNDSPETSEFVAGGRPGGVEEGLAVRWSGDAMRHFNQITRMILVYRMLGW